MAKLTLNTIGSRYGSIDALNDNSDLVEAAFENTLSRDGTGPNNMESDLDMDSNSILNADTVFADKVRSDELYINNTLVVPSNLAQATNANVVQYNPLGTGAVPTTVQAKLRQTVSVEDFGAVADGTTNNTAAVQLALDSLPTAGGLVDIPAGCRFNLTALTFRQNCNMQYYANDDLSTPGPESDIGSGELIYFSANSSWPTDPTGAAVNEWRFTAAFHPGIIVDVRKDVQGANAYLAPGQTLTEPVRASFNILDEQAGGFTLLYKNFSSNSIFSGVSQNTYRRVFTLNGVGTANWPTLPSTGSVITGNTSSAVGFVISVGASSTVLLWFSGEFVAGETLHLASPSSNSTSSVTSVAYTSAPMPPLSQDFLRGGWSIALPPQVVTDSFAVGGRIVSTPTRNAGQYTETVVSDPGFGFKSSYESSVRGRYMVATQSTDFKRIVLRNLTTTADIANVGACIGSCVFATGGGVSSSSFNINTVTKSATGIYDVVFVNPAARDDYSVTVTTGAALDYGFVSNRTVNGFTVNIVQTGTATARDATASVSFACFGGDI